MAEDPITVQGLVNAAYRAILRREADPQGMEAHARLFAGGITEAAVEKLLHGLSNSHEASQLLSSTSVIRNGLSTDEITVAMMVQNEERLLPYSLGSLSDSFGAFVFLDLGSTDRTVSIINDIIGKRAYIISGDPHLILREGFGAARNRAASAIRTTWTLVMDADEVLAGGITDGRVQFERTVRAGVGTLTRRTYKREPWTPGGPLAVEHYTDPRTDIRQRLYRQTSIKWQGYLHEEIVCPHGYVAPSQLVVDHFSSFQGRTSGGEKQDVFLDAMARLFLS
jgi:hypothetical protein